MKHWCFHLVEAEEAEAEAEAEVVEESGSSESMRSLSLSRSPHSLSFCRPSSSDSSDKAAPTSLQPHS